MYSLLRPILQLLDPELAHSMALRALRLAGSVGTRGPLAGRPVHVLGLDFPNPVGLAAGYDKDGVAWRGLVGLGFGHVEIGTVTPRPQPGNPRPRIFRLTTERSLINRLGFPSGGAELVAARLEAERGAPRGAVLGVNLGKQKDTPLDRAAEDYEALLERFAPLADYLVVNVSSPNTPDLRALQDPTRLDPLLARLAACKRTAEDALGRAVPLLIKLSPDLDDPALDQTVDSIRDARLDGIIATNTTTSREGLAPSAAAREAGGLSGRALRERSTRVVARIASRVGRDLPIVACGGVASPSDARDKLDAGATLVQLYTGLVYEGPGLVRRIVEDLARR